MRRFQIHVSGIRTHVQIGAREEEQLLGQSLMIDLELTVYQDLLTDEVQSTLDYSKVIDKVRHFAQSLGRIRLIETFATRLVSDLFEHFPEIESVKTCVQKNYVPITDFTGHVKVVFEQSRNSSLPASC